MPSTPLGRAEFTALGELAKGTHIKKGFFAGIKSKAIKQLGLS